MEQRALFYVTGYGIQKKEQKERMIAFKKAGCKDALPL